MPGPPYDMHAIARAMGYRVRVTRSLRGPLGALIGRTILVRPTSPCSQAMTIGHELAHAIDAEWGVITGRRDAEERFDEVAAAVLMPAHDLQWARELHVPARHLLRRHRPISLRWARRRLAC